MSSSLIYFLIASLALIFLVVLFFYWRARRFNAQQKALDEQQSSRPHSDDDPAQSASNKELVLAQAQVFKAQVADLELERSRGLITEEEFAQAHDELARRLLEDTSGTTNAPDELAPKGPQIYPINGSWPHCRCFCLRPLWGFI